MGHGWEGVVLKLFRGRDFTFTVTGAEQVTEDFRRVTVTDGGLLAATGGAHPTMWVRLWFERDGKPHQRATPWSTPTPLAAGRAPGTPATIWYETAEAAPAFDPSHAPDGKPPFRLDADHHTLHTVPCRDAGAHLVSEVKAALPGLLGEDTTDAYVWIACDTATTRTLASYARKEMTVPKERVNALGYRRGRLTGVRPPAVLSRPPRTPGSPSSAPHRGRTPGRGGAWPPSAPRRAAAARHR